jgi:hypothetical protein
MSQKEDILYKIMYHGTAINENAVIAVTTLGSATYIMEWFKENKLELPMSIVGIIDCIIESTGVSTFETESIKIVSSPVDLTGIGVRISQFFEEFLIKKNNRKIQLHIN